jgi:hypothetical protein
MQLQSDALLALGCLLKCSRRSDIILTMCGRYRLSQWKQLIEEQFDTADWQEVWLPWYNIALLRSQFRLFASIQENEFDKCRS